MRAIRWALITGTALGLVHSTEDFLTEDGDDSSFIREEDVVFSTERADIALEVDLTHVEASLKSTCRAASLVVSNSTLIPGIEALFRELCHSDVENWKRTTDHLFVRNQEIDRPKRFVAAAAAIVSALVVGVGAAIFGNTHDPDPEIRRMAKNQDRIVETIRERDHLGDLRAAHLVQIGSLLENGLHTAITRDRKEEGAILMMGLVLQHRQQIARLSQAITALTTHQKLSPGLINEGILKSKGQSRGANFHDRTRLAGPVEE